MTPDDIEVMRKSLHLLVCRDGESEQVNALCDMALNAANPDIVLVPREPTEAMLRAALDARYCRSKRSRNVKEKFPHGYETWIRTGLVEDAPAIRGEYKAMIDAMKEPKA